MTTFNGRSQFDEQLPRAAFARFDGAAPARVSDWEHRLDAEVRAARGRAFDAQSWNCARFALACVEAQLGCSIEWSWAGDLERTADSVLPRVPVAFARRGDVVLADVGGEAHEATLGICVGAQFVCVSARCLLRFPMHLARAAWRVG